MLAMQCLLHCLCWAISTGLPGLYELQTHNGDTIVDKRIATDNMHWSRSCKRSLTTLKISPAHKLGQTTTRKLTSRLTLAFPEGLGDSTKWTPLRLST